MWSITFKFQGIPRFGLSYTPPHVIIIPSFFLCTILHLRSETNKKLNRQQKLGAVFTGISRRPGNRSRRRPEPYRHRIENAQVKSNVDSVRIRLQTVFANGSGGGNGFRWFSPDGDAVDCGAHIHPKGVPLHLKIHQSFLVVSATENRRPERRIERGISGGGAAEEHDFLRRLLLRVRIRLLGALGALDEKILPRNLPAHGGEIDLGCNWNFPVGVDGGEVYGELMRRDPDHLA